MCLLIAKPSPPENVRVTDVGKSSATLEWQPPANDGGCKVTNYHVYISHEGKDDWKDLESLDSFKLKTEVKNLKFEKKYILAVTAENDIDESEMAMVSEPVIIDRPLDVPSPPVGPIEYSNINKTSATASWHRSKSHGGSPITHYIVDFREKFKRVWSHMTDVRAEGEDLSCELTNLTEGQEYSIQVKAVNSVGASKPLESTTTVKPCSPYSPPSAPRNLKVTEVTSSMATLEWKAPEKDGGTKITKYHVDKREKTYGSWKPEGSVNGSETMLEVTGLKVDTEYFFKVCAENEAGKSPYTDMIGPIKPSKQKCKLSGKRNVFL